MATDRPAQQSEIKQLISKGLEQGYLTYAEVNDHCPTTSSIRSRSKTSSA
jgi:RNA polymerase primary sigma factor